MFIDHYRGLGTPNVSEYMVVVQIEGRREVGSIVGRN